jgi:chaperonin GroEL
VIRVGAPSEAELKNRREAFDDAISATNVPGGGLALLRAIDAVEREAESCTGDERTGVLILKRALETPTRQIAENSGVDGGVVVDRMRGGSGAYGFDAGCGSYVALENAVSVAGVLLLTEATLTEVPEPKGDRTESAEAA